MSRDNLEKEFSEEEILNSLKSRNGDKAPGPEGFFLQDIWHIIKSDLIEVFKDLYDSEKFVKSLNATVLVLIEKVEGAKNIKDFRSISLVGWIYKLISKVLAKRLSLVLRE